MSGITQGVKDFLKGSNQAPTTEVCSEVAPEVTQEHVRPQERVETAEAVDREKHIHHHQHRVQPVEAHETLPTKHVESTGPVIEREHKEDMLPEHQQKLQEQRNAIHDSRDVAEVERSAAHLGTHINEHEHHHIHETVQPVIQKETIQPTTVHHTQAVHETVHEAPIVHEATTLPTMSMEDFKAKHHKESHSDSQHHHQTYEGTPKVGGAEANSTNVV